MSERILKSNFVLVDSEDKVVQLHEKQPHQPSGFVTLKDATIVFKENGTLEVTGNLILWDFTFDKVFVEDLKDKPQEKYIKMGYKTIIDAFKGVKKPFVDMGWYELEKTKPYHCVMSQWFVKL